MNTVQLACFVTLAKTLNFMQTAREMHITQPAVSKQIMTLEEELGAKLFFRTTHQVMLTEEGRSFLKDAQTVLKILHDAETRFRITEKTRAGRFGIGYTDPCAAELLRQILEGFLKDGKFEPSLQMGDTTACLEKLLNGLVDVVIAIRDARFSNSAIAFSRLFDERFYCVMRKEHPLYDENRTFLSEKDFYPYRQIVYIPQYLLDHSFARGRTLFPVNDDLQNIFVSSGEEALLLVRAGAGFTLLPFYETMGAKDLVVMPWVESPHTQFGIYYRKAEESTDGIRQFLSAAEQVVEKMKKDNMCPFVSD